MGTHRLFTQNVSKSLLQMPCHAQPAARVYDAPRLTSPAVGEDSFDKSVELPDMGKLH